MQWRGGAARPTPRVGDGGGEPGGGGGGGGWEGGGDGQSREYRQLGRGQGPHGKGNQVQVILLWRKNIIVIFQVYILYKSL